MFKMYGGFIECDTYVKAHSKLGIVSTCIHAHMYVRTHTCTRARTHTRTHAHTHTHTHTHTFLQILSFGDSERVAILPSGDEEPVKLF